MILTCECCIQTSAIVKAAENKNVCTDNWVPYFCLPILECKNHDWVNNSKGYKYNTLWYVFKNLLM